MDTAWLAVDDSAALLLAQVVADGVTQSPEINAVATQRGNEVDILIWNYHDADLPAEPA